MRDDTLNRPLNFHYEQKKAVYDRMAYENGLQISHATFSDTYQIHGVSLIRKQVCHKFKFFGARLDNQKIGSATKWWSKCISTVIAKTAGRSIAFKSAMMLPKLTFAKIFA